MQNECQNQEQPFDPRALINFIVNVIEPDTAARTLDKAMFFLISYVITENIVNPDQFDLYWNLREMRNAILVGSNNINLD
ncbi:hypothetical protein AHMF7605_22415 [Adhaeribacter arboris]|uniref:Uncharacterized protein n=1 Tax=Adhaeribacter arboris TaxID=2072846 RepID=A0A2T2YKQ9_9BACT|nr:hypothetical protein [Adhaeribacter arboris]PSR56055.1 hypothetical protein AHMF7605_22415 [Adhaeribacter arboris]